MTYTHCRNQALVRSSGFNPLKQLPATLGHNTEKLVCKQLLQMRVVGVEALKDTVRCRPLR